MTATRGKEKFKRDEARVALLDAGWATLLDRGIAPGLDRVTLKEAIERSGVPRTTAYRVFDGPDGALDSFRSALLERLQRGVEAQPSFDLIAELLAEAEEVLASGDGLAKADLFREIIRVALNDRLQMLAATPVWRAYISTLAATSFSDAEVVPKGLAGVGDRFVPLFEAMGDVFGFRPKANLTWLEFASIMTAVVDGAALRMLEEPTFDSFSLTGDPDRPWNGASILGLSLLLVWCEPDPDAETPADLQSWTAFP